MLLWLIDWVLLVLQWPAGMLIMAGKQPAGFSEADTPDEYCSLYICNTHLALYVRYLN